MIIGGGMEVCSVGNMFYDELIFALLRKFISFAVYCCFQQGNVCRRGGGEGDLQ